MAKLEHKNLLAYGDKQEVYAALQRDFNRDTWIQGVWRFVFFGAAVGAIFASKAPAEWLWLFLALLAIERGITVFIDNSNRNWTMHVIDWIERERPTGHRKECP